MQAPPLKGLRVLELARILAGPWIGQTLADLGAQVLKVESPKGDDTRQWGPPFIDHDGERSAAYFHSCNRGKRSVVLNLRDPGDQATLHTLVAEADVVVENFKLGALAKFNMDYDTLSRLNPRLVYCSITGFGQNGPYAARPGYDFLVQAMGGLMSVTGDGQPQKVGVAVTDIVTGLYGVIAIQAALAQRERSGQGQHIDLALLDTTVGIMANQALNYLASGVAPTPLGNAHPNIVPYQSFATRDGHIIIAVGNNAQFARLCAVLQRDELALDPRFRDNPLRVEHRDSLVPQLASSIALWEQSSLLQALEDAHVPCGPINALDAVFADPQVQARQMQIDADGVPGVRTPISFSNASLAPFRPAPKLGAHSPQWEP